MPPVERFVCRFAAEPPQEALPHGSWAQTLQAEFLAACLRIDADGQDLGVAAEPSDFASRADFTEETAERNPDWRIDVCEEVVGRWRGEGGRSADMTLVWGVPLLSRAIVATAELAGLAVDQCALVDDRFTLVAPDNYRGDFLDVKLWDADGRELASESLYVDDEDDAA